MTEWLGHRDLCALQWQQPCDCPCPSCGEPLNVAAPTCKQFAHRNVGKPAVYGQYLAKEDPK